MSILEELSLWWTTVNCESDANTSYPPTYLLAQEESRHIFLLERVKAETTEMKQNANTELNCSHALNVSYRGIHMHEMYLIRVIIHHGV